MSGGDGGGLVGAFELLADLGGEGGNLRPGEGCGAVEIGHEAAEGMDAGVAGVVGEEHFVEDFAEELFGFGVCGFVAGAIDGEVREAKVSLRAEVEVVEAEFDGGDVVFLEVNHGTADLFEELDGFEGGEFVLIFVEGFEGRAVDDFAGKKGGFGGGDGFVDRTDAGVVDEGFGADVGEKAVD